MKSHHLVRFGATTLTLLLIALLIGPTTGVRAQDGGPASDSAAASQPAAPAVALGAAFTYQGRLNDGGNPANGAYDFQFKLFDAASGGTQIGSAASKNDLPVGGGLFTADLDFGAAAYGGQARWLEAAVRPGASTGAYTTLTPRRALLASPYATYSNNTRGIAVTSDGRVGIGTSDPDTSNLRIHGTNSQGTRVFVGNAGSGEAAVVLDASNGDFVGLDYAWIRQADNLDFSIGYGNNERLTIKPSGYIGIGTADPTQLLQVQGSSAPNTGLRVVGNAGGGAVAEFRYPGSMSGGISIAGDAAGQNSADFYLSDGTLLVRNNIAGKNIALLTTGGNVGIGTNSPGSRLDVNGDISLNGDISVSPQKLLVYRPDDRFAVDGKSMGHYLSTFRTS